MLNHRFTKISLAKKAGLSVTASLLLATSALADEPTSNAAGDAPSNEELYEIIQAQQEQLDAMNSQTSSGDDALSIGGYGELHYNNIDNEDDEIDFHRFVLYFGYDFTDRLRFFSELELEHALAGDGKPGEVELEQAYIEYDISSTTHIKGGVFLIPVGILNETHEPNTFYGVERNNIEKNIIPTTWWEGGVALNGELVAGSGLSYDIALHSGLQFGADDDGDKDFLIRSARQKVAEAAANDFAITGRLKYTGVPGLELASTVIYQDDATQDSGNGDISMLLVEAHAIYSQDNWEVRALVANVDLNGDAPAQGDNAASAGRDQQVGGYLEGSFKPTSSIGLYSRYSFWDNNAGSDSDLDTGWNRIEIGANYWPHEDVVVKVDVFDQEQNEDNDSKGFNLGIGYQFGS